MTRKQADVAVIRCQIHAVPLGDGINVWEYIEDLYPHDGGFALDDTCASILLSELATGAKEILPELDR